MKILALNRGSSSIKCALYDLPGTQTPLWKREIDSKRLTKNFFPNCTIDCIGHRIVHGGQKYMESVFIDIEVKEEIRKLGNLAPLHNLADLKGIELVEKIFPGTPQVAVFDTAFHHTIPRENYTYPGPYKWLENGIRKYGFHGISYQFCSKEVEKVLGKIPEKMVICHLGSGASLCALKMGKSIDTTMGFTPLDGLMMNTRSGSLDPGILLYLMKEKGDIAKVLYEESGLLGLSGISSDMRDILKSDSKRAKLSLGVYIHRLCSCIGSMAASLEGLDALVFTGGIGENAGVLREEVIQKTAYLRPKDILVIQTNEELEIAKECLRKIQRS